MVAAVRYYLKAYGFVGDNDRFRDLASDIFADDGYDPYLEDIGTIWLLHYFISTSGYATSYFLFFNYFRKLKPRFTRTQFKTYLVNETVSQGKRFSENSIKKDVAVLVNNYNRSSKLKHPEDGFNSFMYELGLIEKNEKIGNEDVFMISNKVRENLPPRIVLACIRLSNSGSTVTLQELQNGINQIGNILVLSSMAIRDVLDKVNKLYPQEIIIKEDAGVQTLQIKSTITIDRILNDYYND